MHYIIVTKSQTGNNQVHNVFVQPVHFSRITPRKSASPKWKPLGCVCQGRTIYRSAEK